jgi:hypothetical protein
MSKTVPMSMKLKCYHRKGTFGFFAVKLFYCSVAKKFFSLFPNFFHDLQSGKHCIVRPYLMTNVVLLIANYAQDRSYFLAEKQSKASSSLF